MPFETIAEGIESLRQKSIAELELNEDPFYIPLLGKRFISVDDAVDLEGLVSDFFSSQNTKRVCTLFGEGGAGKSSYLKRLALKCWQEYATDKPIPIFISLPHLQDPIHKAIEEPLIQHGFSETQVDALKASYSFIFIFDGYDELHLLKNLYVSNRLYQWQAKTIISCRTQYFYNKSDPNLYFVPIQNEREQRSLLQTLYVAPFTQEQIEAYLTAMRQSGVEVPEYVNLQAILGLMDIITTPFLLRLAVEALPTITARAQQSTNSENEIQRITQNELYKCFVERWFERQEKKLKESGHITLDMPDQKPTFWRYAQALAIEMHKYDLTWLNVRDSRFEIFFENDVMTEMLRTACPLKKVGATYGFWHQSLSTYFTTHTMYEEIMSAQIEKTLASITINSLATAEDSAIMMSEERPTGTIHLRLITDDPAALRSLADDIQTDSCFKQRMFDIIEQSKTNEHYAIGAANAISALNTAEISFSGMNLSHISIPGANLRGALLEKTNLEEANLSHSNLSNSWLNNCNLTGADLKNVNFYQLPQLEFLTDVTVCCYSPNSQWFAVALSGGGIHIFDSVTFEHIETFSFIGLEQSDYDSSFENDQIMQNDIIAMGPVNSLSFSPDSNYLASGGTDINIRLWSIPYEAIPSTYSKLMTHDKFIRTFRGHEKSITKVLFTNDGKNIVSSSLDACILIWDTDTAEVIRTINREFLSKIANMNVLCSYDLDGPIIDIAMNSRENLLLSIHEKKTTDGCRRRAYFWNFETFKLLNNFNFFSEGDYTAIVFSSNGQYLALAHESSRVLILSIETNEVKFSFIAPGVVSSLLFKPDDTEIFICTPNNITSFHLETRKILFQIHNAETIQAMAFLAKDNIITSGTGDGKIKFWNINDSNAIYSEAKINPSIHQLVASSLSNIIVSIGDDITSKETLYLWDFKMGLIDGPIVLSRPKELSILPNIIAYHPNGQWVVVNADFGALIWDLQSKQIVYRIAYWGINDQGEDDYDIHPGYQNCEKDRVISGAAMPARMLGKIYPTYSSTRSLSFDCSGKYLATGGKLNIVHVWDFQQGRLVHKLLGHTQCITHIVPHPNENILLTGSHDGTVRIWLLETGKLLRFFALENKKILALNINSNGDIVVAGDEQSNVYFWSFHSGELKQQFHYSNGFSCSFSFNKSGKILAIGTSQKLVILWDMLNNCILKEKIVSVQKESSVSLTWISKDKNEFLITGGKDKAVRAWLFIRDEAEVDLILCSMKGQRALIAENATIITESIDHNNEHLLQQVGAETKLKKDFTEYFYDAFRFFIKENKDIFVEEAKIKSLVLLLNHKIVEIKKQSLKALLNMMRDDEDESVGSYIYNSGCIKLLVQFLDNQEFYLKNFSLMLLANLALEDNLKDEIRDTQGVVQIVLLLNDRESEIRELAITAIGNLVQNSSANKEAVRKTKGIDILLCMLTDESAQIKENALNTLLCLSYQDLKNKETICAGNGVELLVDLIRNNNFEIRKLAVEMLFSLTEDNPIAQEEMQKTGRIEQLIELLRDANEEIRLRAAGALWHSAFGNVINQNKIRQAGGIGWLTNLLSDKCVDIRVYAMHALSSLAFFNKCNQHVIRETGGFLEIVEYLSVKHTELQVCAAKALWSLVEDNSLNKRIFFQPDIIVTLEQLLEKPSVKLFAGGALLCLISEDKYRDKVREAGLIPLFVDLFNQHNWWRCIALKALFILIQNHYVNQQIIIDSGALELILEYSNQDENSIALEYSRAIIAQCQWSSEALLQKKHTISQASTVSPNPATFFQAEAIAGVNSKQSNTQPELF